MAALGPMPYMVLIQDYGVNASTCGYCRSDNDTSVSHGMTVSNMPVETYQALLDRGWRRSGRWLYKPALEHTCCQLITIRLDVHRFQPNKDQRKVARKWESYLAGAPLKASQTSPAQHPAAAPPNPPPEVHSPWEGPEPLPVPMSEVQGGSPKRSRAATHWMSSSPEQKGGGKRFRGSHEALDELDGQHQESLFRPSLPRPVSVSDQLTSIHINSKGTPVHTAGRSVLTNGNGVQLVQLVGQRGGETLFLDAPSPQLAALAAPTQMLPVEDACSAARSLLEVALKACIAAGMIPEAAYPGVKVQGLTERQQKQLPADAVCTSALALAVAGIANQKLSQQGGTAMNKLTPDSVAAVLCAHLQLGNAPLRAEPLKGHINFFAAAPTPAAPVPPPAAQQVAKVSGNTADPHRPAHQGDTTSTVSTSTTVPRSVPRHFEVRVLPSHDPSLLAMEFDLYRKYQVVHHGDAPSDATPRSFKRFLCDSPLAPAPAAAYPPGYAPPGGFGSFHQQYFLDGKLVAVGVVDVLPRCLSSKYLFWEPDLGPLSLGKLSSLKEIEWVRTASASCPSLHYYYMGFYVHTCHRMRYKADFAPSDLLCPVTKCWVPIDRVRSALEGPGRPNLAAVPGVLKGLGPENAVEGEQPACPPTDPSDAEVGAIKLFVPLPSNDAKSPKGQVLSFARLCELGALPRVSQDHLKARLKEWMVAVGPATAATMMYQL